MHGLVLSACWFLSCLYSPRHRCLMCPPGPPAHTQQADVKTEAAPGQHALEASDLESFFDGIVPLQLERSDVAGASVLVMQNGQVLLRKGYGYADLKSKKPVDPGDHHLPSGIDIQAIYLDFCDAAGGAGKTRPRYGREPLSRFPDSAGVFQAHHLAQPDDPHRRI